MTTGVIGVVNGIGSLSYTAPTDAKVRIIASTSAASDALTVNGVSAAIRFVSTAPPAALDIFVGQGATLTVAAITSNTSFVMSVLES